MINRICLVLILFAKQNLQATTNVLSFDNSLGSEEDLLFKQASFLIAKKDIGRKVSSELLQTLATEPVKKVNMRKKKTRQRELQARRACDLHEFIEYQVRQNRFMRQGLGRRDKAKVFFCNDRLV